MTAQPVQSAQAVVPEAVARIREPVHIVVTPEGSIAAAVHPAAGQRVVGTLPPLYPERLGDRGFCEAHGIRFAYVAGEMANGISTTALVKAMAQADMLAFFGAGGVPLPDVQRAVRTLVEELPGRANWGVNLIHNPLDPAQEEAVVNLLLYHRVPTVSVSAFMDLTPTVVRLATSGLRRDQAGRVVRRTRVVAKVSRPETAEKFLRPPPADLLAKLRADGRITQDEARLAARIPVASDLTVEADSGGHTDNRPLTSLLPRIIELRDRAGDLVEPGQATRVGAAGGLGTPQGVAAAYAAGAAYVLTGSVNQVCVEAGVSSDAKALLAQADVADTMMASSSDMFELGVRVQVLRRGTMFGARSNQLYEAYRDHGSLEEIPPGLRQRLERTILRATFDEVWDETRRYWQMRAPAVLAQAEADPKARMALVFRWYVGKASRWAIEGDISRRGDYQLWCGPALGAFNHWVAGSFLAHPANRDVVQVARNLLEGAAVLTRAHQLRTFGVAVPSHAFRFTPRRLA
ncbi:PfaD family polyunsaturated fatty acid/polyketide biosynthesis protein [Streptomyces nigra]|uniref:PfaD family polyunsaturated fatty acid/polyketide biosynthesis protein n=1 Tax=Streptomyces nigra TaxID=1827580 RepID=UPI003646E5CB